MSDYLWDRSGRPDPETAELERLLGRFQHDGRPLAGATIHTGKFRNWSVAAAAVAIVAITGWWWSTDVASQPGGLQVVAGGLQVVAGGRVLDADDWFVATASNRELALGKVGKLTLEPGSRFQVKQIADHTARFYLAEGRLHAVVDSTVQPRFFQVDTPSARCVDLGCEYHLEVDDQGDSYVAVSLGQIAFELDDRDVFVPRGAICRASKSAGLGTPRFKDAAPFIHKLLDALDNTRDLQRRRDFAEKVIFSLETERDTLSLWHLLQDGDSHVAELAERRLVEIAGHPLEMKGTPPVDAPTWRAHLEGYWR